MVKINILIILALLYKSALPCGQNRSMTLILHDNYHANLHISGGLAPVFGLGDYFTMLNEYKEYSNSQNDQNNDYVVITGDVNSVLIYSWVSELTKNISGLDVLLIRDFRKFKMYTVKLYNGLWTLYEINEMYESDDWCGVNWQYEYYLKLNNYVIINNRIKLNPVYTGSIYMCMKYYMQTNKYISHYKPTRF